MGIDDKARDKAEELSGEAKQKAGEAVGNERMQAEGRAKKSKGSLKQAGEKIKDAFKR